MGVAEPFSLSPQTLPTIQRRFTMGGGDSSNEAIRESVRTDVASGFWNAAWRPRARHCRSRAAF